MGNIQTTTFLQDLKVQTKALHDATEAVAFSKEMQSGVLTLEMYKKLTQSNLYIHQSLEKAFEKALNQLTAPDLQNFVDKKSDWLEKDRVMLAIPEQKMPINSSDTPSFASPAELIGGLYVVEGSMLGGRFIVKLLQQNPVLKKLPMFHFYNGYGANTGHRWKSFQQLAKATLLTQENYAATLTKAKETFSFFQAVYTKNNKL